MKNQIEGGISEFPELKGDGNLRVKQGTIQGAWDIRLPRLPWKSAEARRERISLLSRLFRKYAVAVLWGPAGGDLTQPFSWSFPAESQLPELIESLYEGGWTLLFFNDDPKDRLRTIRADLMRPNELMDVLTSLSARAAISSWYDDNEWLLLFSDS